MPPEECAELQLEDINAFEVHTTSVDRLLERNHYLRSTPAGAYHRYLITGGLLHGVVGAAMWGRPESRHNDREGTVQLTRFWTEDYTPKNTESRVLSQMMRDMHENGFERLISYASVARHEGTVYKATNWMNLGLRWPSASWENRDGRTMRDGGVKWLFEFWTGWFA